MSDPADVFQQMGDLFSQLFGAAGTSAPGPRVLPLVLTERAYRDAASQTREVRFRRVVRCACQKEMGCRRCGRVGWTLKGETISVKVPPGATAGTVLRIAGKGDELSNESRDLHLEVVEVGERADVLTKNAQAHDEFFSAKWAGLSTKNKAQVRKADLTIAAFAVGIVAVIGGLYLAVWLPKATIGEHCNRDEDCRSSQCLVMSKPAGFLLSTETGRVCTDTCVVDSDCPGAMKCVGASRTLVSLPIAPSTPDRYVCAPPILGRGDAER